jgi:histidinol-phosphate aminotransferase
MPLSRRSFLNAVTAGAPARPSASFVAARGREAMEAESGPAPFEPAPVAGRPEGAPIRIDSNENPIGPGAKAMEGLVAAFEDAGRYPTNSRPSHVDLRAAIAKANGVKPENVVLGSGSREVLRSAVRIHTSASRPLVVASPTFEQTEKHAEQLGTPARRVRVTAEGKLDLDKMAEAAKGAGLVFFCNPNNPTATVHSAKAVADFVARIKRESPDTAILIDEAYHDYVTDPAYATAIPVALEQPGVFVARTFSKAYGMAGLRIGYAVGQPKTMEAFAKWAMPYNVSTLAVGAAIAAIQDPEHIAAERARNTQVRDYTVRFFKDAGFKVMDSQANFLFVDIGRPAKEFRDACRAQNVQVGREFAPFEKTHARISIGTMDEMKRACEVFATVLGIAGTASSSSGRGGSEK